MIIVIDNYDSFTYNLVQLLGCFGHEVRVYRNDGVSVAEIQSQHPDHIVISPGPGHPRESGICVDLVHRLGHQVPILGVCLGHQAIALAFGAQIELAPSLYHGKSSPIYHQNQGIFQGIPSPVIGGRYHSLTVSAAGLPSCLSVDAITKDGEAMGISHRENPIYGVQFHPESILTEHGPGILENFLQVR